MSRKTISLEGAEISVLKSLGFGGTPVLGKELKVRMVGIGKQELFDLLKGLSDTGFVCSDPEMEEREDKEEFDRTSFYVNPAYTKELKEAMDPNPKPSKRVRRE